MVASSRRGDERLIHFGGHRQSIVLFKGLVLSRINAALPQRIANQNPFGKATVMWRALFLAVGIYMCILGAECLAVETFEMAAEEPAAELGTPATLFGNPPANLARREIE